MSENQLEAIPEVMMAVQLTGNGGPEKLAVLHDIPVPDIGEDEVLIRGKACGVNNTDINTRVGWYSKSVTAATSSKGFGEIEDEGFEIPWIAIGGGIATSSAIILVLHLRRTSATEIAMPKKKTKQNKKATKNEVESVERSCPSCGRKLRIPGDYSGTVRCPDCSERFDVEAEIEDEPEEEDVDELEVIETLPEKVEISCPECPSTLRVPSDYSGSVRCPSCSTIFSAKQNE